MNKSNYLTNSFSLCLNKLPSEGFQLPFPVDFYLLLALKISFSMVICSKLQYNMQQENNFRNLPNPNPKKRSRRKIVESESSETERQLYFPDLYEYKKLNLSPEKVRVLTGSWSLEENKIYLHFLQKYKRDFASEEIRRRTVVFNRLSKMLHKRTPDQCRSHHQKLQNRFNNRIEAIVHFVEEKIKRRERYGLTNEQYKSEKDFIIQKTRDNDEHELEEGIIIDFESLAFW